MLVLAEALPAAALRMHGPASVVALLVSAGADPVLSERAVRRGRDEVLGG